MVYHGRVCAKFYYNVIFYMWEAIPIEYLAMFLKLYIGKCLSSFLNDLKDQIFVGSFVYVDAMMLITSKSVIFGLAKEYHDEGMVRVRRVQSPDQYQL